MEGAGESALRALERIWAEAFDVKDGVAHRVGGGASAGAGAGAAGGYLEDQALFAQALLDAFEWTQRGEYLERARRVVEVMLRRYVEPESGALADRPRGEDDAIGPLATPHLPIVDAPAPSGNAVAALVLLRLAALVDAPEYRRHADSILQAFAGFAAMEPTGVATYLRAVEWATLPVTTVVVVARAGETGGDALLRTALSSYRPRTVVRRLELGALEGGAREGAGAARPELEGLPAELRAMLSADTPLAYICVGNSCAAPIDTAAELRELLGSFRG
jgi:uncharacterized protein YyaL (SSP411 family)